MTTATGPQTEYRSWAVEEYRAEEEPYYVPVNDEIEIFSISQTVSDFGSMACSLSPYDLTVQSFFLNLFSDCWPTLQNCAISASRIHDTDDTDHVQGSRHPIMSLTRPHLEMRRPKRTGIFHPSG